MSYAYGPTPDAAGPIFGAAQAGYGGALQGAMGQIAGTLGQNAANANSLAAINAPTQRLAMLRDALYSHYSNPHDLLWTTAAYKSAGLNPGMSLGPMGSLYNSSANFIDALPNVLNNAFAPYSTTGGVTR